MKSRFLFNHLDAHRDYFHTYPKSKLVLRDWLALIILAAGISLYLKIKIHYKNLQKTEAYEKTEDDL